ncbi:MAG TPA: hypothetical protein VEG27_06515 [Usitatibacter sp.]|nr:hypothetical protein [Usitatibacter sp.]
MAALHPPRLRRIALAAALALACAWSLSAHAVGRLADVRIFDRTLGRELPVLWHDGRAYVVGRPGDEYEVSVRNRAGEDLLAVMSVDGVNVVTGQTASPAQSGYVLGAWERTEVRGWRKSLRETAAFYFTDLGDSYAARTGRPADVGVIGVALFRRARPAVAPESVAPMEPPDAERRRMESSNAAPGARVFGVPSAPLGTGHGRREDSPARYAQFERATEAPAETVAIYYDSWRNLVARGVIAPRYGRRDPDPFPAAFVPDP